MAASERSRDAGDDRWAPPAYAPLKANGQPKNTGPKPRRLERWHRGQAWIAATVLVSATIIAVIVIAPGLRMVASVALPLWLIIALVLGHHKSCPRCGTWRTRVTLSTDDNVEKPSDQWRPAGHAIARQPHG